METQEKYPSINLEHPSIADERTLESFYKHQAEEQYRLRIEELKQKGNITNTTVGTSMKKVLIDDFCLNMKTWTEAELKPKRGVQKKYHQLVIKMVEAMGIDNFILTACTHTLEYVINTVFRTEHKDVSTGAKYIGENIYEEARLQAFLKEEGNDKQENRIQNGLDKRTQDYIKKKHIRYVMERFDYQWYKPKPVEIVALGFTLIDILVQTTDLIEYRQGQRCMEINATDKFIQIFKSSAMIMTGYARDLVPMIIKPKPWTDLEDGGYYGVLGEHLKFIRINFYVGKTKIVKSYLNKLREVDLSTVMGAVNKIQETPYRINKPILSIVNQIVDQGGDMAGIERLDPLPYVVQKKGERAESFRERLREREHKEQTRQSKALRALRIINYARNFERYKEIYFPCNIDFRGRIYPVSTFSHQGDDLMKSLIVYAEPVATTQEDDLDLLKIQGCNLWGNDKVSLRDRVKWVDDNLQDILQSAKDPMDYQWWLQADEPLQFLAFCMEMVDVLEYIQTNKTFIGYLCKIPIAYDGTCSGLQHYSAMLHDEVGGSAVNLIDHEKPADIYQEVANKVLEKVKWDAVNGMPDNINKEEKGGGQRIHFGTKTLAQTWLAYGITRKVCKRPVMTLAYGSGQYGFQEQLLADITSQHDEFKRIEVPCAKYMAKLIWEAVQTVVVSATEGMKYLKALAKELTKHGMPVNWWTPLGLPVQQQYLKEVTYSFRTRLGKKMSMPIYYRVIDENEKLDPNRQRNGIAPNFIHSLDSTHLMMTVNASNLRNYTTIHDSFGTSLGEARQLKKVIREQLYKLYTEHKPLEQFKEYVEEQTGEPVDIELPKLGNLDLSNILTSTFVFH